MPLIVKIQSKSDIITNSSSEVFTTVHFKYEADEELRELVNAILAAGGSDYACEDLFDIKYDNRLGRLTVTPIIATRSVQSAAIDLENLENLFEAWED